MDERSEVSIRDEINHINSIPYSERHIEIYRRLNDLEAEIRRRHPELQHGASYIPPIADTPGFQGTLGFQGKLCRRLDVRSYKHRKDVRHSIRS
jgi:hypothetical protein